MPAWAFINELTRMTGCGILLDVNKVYVNSVNHQLDAQHFIAQIKQGKSAQGAKHASIAKPAARGTYAIVGNPTPDLLKIEKLLDRNIIW